MNVTHKAVRLLCAQSLVVSADVNLTSSEDNVTNVLRTILASPTVNVSHNYFSEQVY